MLYLQNKTNANHKITDYFHIFIIDQDQDQQMNHLLRNAPISESFVL